MRRVLGSLALAMVSSAAFAELEPQVLQISCEARDKATLCLAKPGVPLVPMTYDVASAFENFKGKEKRCRLVAYHKFGLTNEWLVYGIAGCDNE